MPLEKESRCISIESSDRIREVVDPVNGAAQPMIRKRRVTPKVDTPATSWLEVVDEKKVPIAIKDAPIRKSPRYPVRTGEISGSVKMKRSKG